MITDRERREVAESLRHTADYLELKYMEQFIEQLQECTLFDMCYGADYREMFQRLADLIDPDTSGQCLETRPETSGIDREALLKLADEIANTRVFCAHGRIEIVIDVIRWVSDHGGVENLMTKSSHERQRARWEERKERMKRHIAELERKCAERKLETERLRSRIDEMRPRLMPEGMEWLVEAWPRFEDDAPLKLGDMALIDGDADMVEAVQLWIHGRPVIYGDGGSHQLERGEHVKRPTPKVYDADGAEIRVGDTVYHVKDGSEMTAYGIEGEWLVVSVGGRVRHDVVTHRVPVLAADGKPLREGETVWHVKTGREYVVVEPSYGKTVVVRLAKYDDAEGEQYMPDQLTHQRPETRQSIVDEIGEEMAKRIDAIVSAGRWN